jgi:pimeloyl-ACP methyl ester carboxylesterase
VLRIVSVPATPLLLVHGAASGAWVWDFWRTHLSALGWRVNVLDLRGHGRSLPTDLSNVTMEDYVADVASVTRQIAAQGPHPVLGGWGMGGLVVAMYASAHADTPALLLFSPSLPLEVAGRAEAERVRAVPAGTFGPEELGLYINDSEASKETLHDLSDEEAAAYLEQSRGALESGMAARQRLRGIAIPPGSIRCPSLLIYGAKDRVTPPELQRRLAFYLGGETLEAADAGHWGIVYHEDTVKELAPGVDAWLRRHVS